MHYLTLQWDEVADGLWVLDTMASTAPARHAAVMAEVQVLIDWAWRRFPHGHGPVDEGHDWDHDVQCSVEGGQWHVVTLTLTGSARFVREFREAFGDTPE